MQADPSLTPRPLDPCQLQPTRRLVALFAPEVQPVEFLADQQQSDASSSTQYICLGRETAGDEGGGRKKIDPTQKHSNGGMWPSWVRFALSVERACVAPDLE